MQANVTSPGFVRVVPTGMIVSRRGGSTYVAPLLPQLFLGASGEQLTSWRQWVGGTGEQTILTKPAGDLLIPREELYWKKLAEPTPTVQEARITAPSWMWALPIVAIAGIFLYFGLKK